MANSDSQPAAPHDRDRTDSDPRRRRAPAPIGPRQPVVDHEQGCSERPQAAARRQSTEAAFAADPSRTHAARALGMVTADIVL